MSQVYLSGPDIYHPQAFEIDENKKSICERYGLEGVSALDVDGGRHFNGEGAEATNIFEKTRELIIECDLLVANISPFRGPSLESGTALEIGLMLGLGKPVVGYSLDTKDYSERLMALHNVFELPLNQQSRDLIAPDGLVVENFGNPEGAIISGALLSSKMPISEDFESAVRWGRRLLTD